MRWTFFEIQSDFFFAGWPNAPQMKRIGARKWISGPAEPQRPQLTCHAANGSPGTLGLNFERNLCVTSDAPESVHVAFA